LTLATQYCAITATKG